MRNQLRLGVVQMNSRSDKDANLASAERLIDEAAARGAELVSLPEYVSYLGPKDHHEQNAEAIPGPTTERFAAKAREHGIYLHGGSILENSRTPGKYYNTTTLFDPGGNLIATYRKIHLFDIDITGNVSANESATILPGEDIVTANVDGHRVGMTICYDLRFPELFRGLALNGAEIIFVPAAFTMFTGKDHWYPLLKARAIENQCYIVASAQFGTHEPNAQCYGHSIVIDPWGTVLVDAPDREGVVIADLSFEYLQKVRQGVPSLANRRPAAYEKQTVSL